jgi:hypothetical protein
MIPTSPFALRIGPNCVAMIDREAIAQKIDEIAALGPITLGQISLITGVKPDTFNKWFERKAAPLPSARRGVARVFDPEAALFLAFTAALSQVGVGIPAATHLAAAWIARKAPMSEIIILADTVDPNDPEGRTYRQRNAAKAHAFPVASLVEMENGVRLFVAQHTRDCDQSPLYSLATDQDDLDGDYWLHGFGEERLSLVEGRKAPLTDPNPTAARTEP